MNARAQARQSARPLIEQVLGIARLGHGRAVVSGGSKPFVLITKQVSELADQEVRSILSGIELATRASFHQAFESAGVKEWILRSRQIDVTVRCIS